jgi:hypothetical protein
VNGSPVVSEQYDVVLTRIKAAGRPLMLGFDTHESVFQPPAPRAVSPPASRPPASRPPAHEVSATFVAQGPLGLTVWARPGRLSGLSVFYSESVLYGAFVWARRVLNSQKRWFPVRAVPDGRRARAARADQARHAGEKATVSAQQLGQL